MKPALSIVVCTRNRARFLEQTLRRLAAIRCREPWQLVLVDNGSTDETAAVLKRFAVAADVDVKLVHEKRKGLSRARNAGWTQADAAYVAFTDDDCYPAEDYVDSVLATVRETGADYFGGRILLHDPDDYPLTILTTPTPFPLPASTILRPGLVQGANMGLSRRALEAIDGFDEYLGAGTPFPAEDIDVIVRASVAGFAGVYDPRPLVWHHHRRRDIAEVRRHEGYYAVGRGAFYAKCLLDRRARGLVLREWYWTLRNEPLLEILKWNLSVSRVREVAGGFRFLVHRLWPRTEGVR